MRRGSGQSKVERFCRFICRVSRGEVIKKSIIWDEIEKAKKRLSRETGTIIKDWGGKLPFAVVYPNTYYVGMSNLGLQAIYGFLNRYDDVVCERAFWDKENSTGQITPLGVESQRPLNDFAILAFSVNYELDYFNIAPLLKASGIPFWSAERDSSHPLVIAGGPCIMANPLPLAPFFDCLCIGEAETILPAMLPVLREGLSGNREDLLKTLSEIPGVYVPRFYSGSPVTRQCVKDLDIFPVHSVVLTPDTELGDMYLIEVERGCGWACRFCLVNSTYSPLRFRSKEVILQQAAVGLQYRKRIGLVGPTVTDHPQIEGLLDGLLELGAGLAVSSLRINSLSDKVLENMVQGGISSVTIAPEAGSERLRRVIKKDMTETDILQAIDRAAQHGIKQLKLYFMLGLPSETEDDIQAIIDLVLAGKEIIDKNRSKIRLTLNLSPFIPKAGTPFQWLPMELPELLEQRISQIKNRLKPHGIEVKTESPYWSEVQTVLSRGNTELAPALADIEKVSLSEWRKTVEKHRIDVEYYAHRRWDMEHLVPWSIINPAAASSRLKSELTKSLSPAR
jgi:radical SAM superfamily enzyme YgiQ (UPF0313 family)